jgi:acyl-CoA synthetase (AMP-forming)/AMP-acid ligase II
MERPAWASFPPVHYGPARSLHGALERTADRLPEHVAIRFGDEHYSFRDLDGLSNAFARILLERGVRTGTRVAIMASNRPEFAISLFAVLKLGCTIVAMSPAWKRADVGFALDLTNPTHVIHDEPVREVLDPHFDSSHLVDLDAEGLLATLVEQSGERLDVEMDWATTDSVLVFSSGTTGLPKAVRHTHRTLGAAVVHWRSSLGLTADDSFQVTTPPFHVLGLLNLLTAATVGSSVRLHPRFDVDAFLAYAEHDRTTLEMAVAPIALALAQHPDLERFDLSSLRYVVWGATPITESVAELVTERSGVRWMPGYGASEVPVISLNPVRRPDLWRLDSAGIPVHDVTVRVADLDSGHELPSGASGELQVKSPSTMAGYLPADANADAFADGWYRTGDIGWVDEDGWVHITDRSKEMIKVRGFQVAPAEIEAVLLAVPAVADCAVFGVADTRLGEAVVAAVQVREGKSVEAKELEEAVRTSLASYKQLRHVVFVDEIPRLPSGKVLRRSLKEQWVAEET